MAQRHTEGREEQDRTQGPQPDLMKIRGVGRDYERMLVTAGVRSIKELSQEDPTNLSDSLLEVNLLSPMVEAVPSEKRVAGWVRQAQELITGD